jgi:hypothetical protein
MVYTHTFAARMKKNTAITAEVIRICWIDLQVMANLEICLVYNEKWGADFGRLKPHLLDEF